jgi:hypothetical protein
VEQQSPHENTHTEEELDFLIVSLRSPPQMLGSGYCTYIHTHVGSGATSLTHTYIHTYKSRSSETAGMMRQSRSRGVSSSSFPSSSSSSAGILPSKPHKYRVADGDLRHDRPSTVARKVVWLVSATSSSSPSSTSLLAVGISTVLYWTCPGVQRVAPG